MPRRLRRLGASGGPLLMVRREWQIDGNGMEKQGSIPRAPLLAVLGVDSVYRVILELLHHLGDPVPIGDRSDHRHWSTC